MELHAQAEERQLAALLRKLLLSLDAT